ncbi:hypothetical protein [Paenibacillus sp. B01]|uniref:hypothetical protein n=1 Tax=Paenibacillus sp. B01 TaxID=2660554 RepID=UPI00189133CA|nr:hypothetical protein [Paenibacillus sp. B01]
MNGSDVVMTIWAEKGLRQIYCDRASDSSFVRELAGAARRAGLSVHGCSSLAAALSAAEGYALASGSPAAAIGTSAELSRAEAASIRALSAASVPLLLLLPGCAGRPSRSGSGFKSSALLRQEDDCRSTLEKAYFLAARHGRKGPALVRLAPSFAGERSRRPPFSMPAYEDSEDYMERLVSEPPIRDEQLDRIADGLARARRPLIVVGGGVLHAGAAAELGEFIALTDIPAAATPGGWSALAGGGRPVQNLVLPVTSLPGGRNVLPGEVPNAQTGLPAAAAPDEGSALPGGVPTARELPAQGRQAPADYVLVLGSGEPAPAASGARIDIDPAALARPEEAALERLQSDIRLFLTALSARWLARGLRRQPALLPQTPEPAPGCEAPCGPIPPAAPVPPAAELLPPGGPILPAAALPPAAPLPPASALPSASARPPAALVPSAAELLPPSGPILPAAALPPAAPLPPAAALPPASAHPPAPPVPPAAELLPPGGPLAPALASSPVDPVIPDDAADGAESCRLPGSVLLARRGWSGLPELQRLLLLEPGQRLLLLAGPAGHEADAALGASHGAPSADVTLLLPCAAGRGAPLLRPPARGAPSARVARLRRPSARPMPKA